MLVASLVTLAPLALNGPALYSRTVSPSGSLQPARLAKFVMAICHVEPSERVFVTLRAIVGGRSLFTTRYNSPPGTFSETYWPDTTPPPPTVTGGRPAPDTTPAAPAKMSLKNPES